MKRKHWKIIIITLLVLICLPILITFIAFTFYKAEITAMIIEQLKKDYDLEVKVKDLSFSFTESWPNSTIYLYNSEFRASSQKNEPFFTANKIGLSFNLKQLLQKEFMVNSVIVKDAVIQLLVDTAGVNNFTLREQYEKPAGGQAVKFDVKKVKLENVRFLFMNKKLRKSIGLCLQNVLVKPRYYSDGVQAHVDGDVFFNQLLFKPAKGPFLLNRSSQINLDLTWFKQARSLFIHPNSFTLIDGQKYNLASIVKCEKKPFKLSLFISGKNLDATRTVKLLNNNLKKAMAQINLEDPVDADVLIVTLMGKPREPEIVANISGRNNKLTIGENKIPYKNVSFTGKVISIAEPGKAPDPTKGKIIFKNVIGSIYNFPFKADIVITNFVSPRIALVGEIDADADKFDFEKSKKLKLGGKCYARIKYHGPTRYVNKKQFLNDSMKLNADFHFKNLSIKAGPKAPEYILNGVAKVNNHDLKFNKLVFKTKGGNIFLTGNAMGFTEYACGISKGFNANITASTDYIDITPLLVKDETKKNKNYAKELKEAKKSHFNFNVAVKARQLRFRQFNAYSADAQVNYTNSDIIIPRLKLNSCEGTLTGKAWLEDFSDLTANIVLKDMNVNTLFKECENFKQKAITDKNIQGVISGTIDINCELNTYFDVEPTSLDGKIKVKLVDGHLLNYEPMQNISKFIFRNRNFDDISFTEVNETFDIKGTEMTIHDFELASNVINLFLNGVYNFRGESNINMRIPWSNLKRRGENYVPKNLGEDGKDAKGLKLNYHGPAGKMKLKLGNR